MTDARVAAAATRLREAEASHRAIEPLTSTWTDLDLETAYAVQLANVQERLAAGAIIVGHKVGLTARAMQEMLGVDEPDFGHLFDDMILPDASSVGVERFLAPRVEPEVAFVLGRPLRGPGVDLEAVLAATDAVAPALEIIDSRIRDWRITLPDTVADNASSGAVVLGPRIPYGAAAVDVSDLQVSLRVDEEIAEEGSTAAVLDHPGNAVAWLANTLAGLGSGLDAGHVVMPGSCTRAVEVAKGRRVEATFGPLGSVSVEFT